MIHLITLLVYVQYEISYLISEVSRAQNTSAEQGAKINTPLLVYLISILDFVDSCLQPGQTTCVCFEQFF